MLVTSIFSFSHNVSYPFKEKLQNLSHNEIVVVKMLKAKIMLFNPFPNDKF